MSFRGLGVIALLILIAFGWTYTSNRYRAYALQSLARTCRADVETSFFDNLSPTARAACRSFLQGNAKAFEPLVDRDPPLTGEFLTALAMVALLGGLLLSVALGSGAKGNDFALFGGLVICLVLARVARWEFWEHFASFKLWTIR